MHALCFCSTSDSCHHPGLLVTCTVEGAQIATLQAPKSQTLQHVLARAQVDCPEAYALTLVGDNVLTQRRVIFRGIDRDARGVQGNFLTLHELCHMATFDVYAIEIGYPFPDVDVNKQNPECISSDDEAAAGPRAQASPPGKNLKKAAAPLRPPSPSPPPAKRLKKKDHKPPSPQVQRQWPASRGQGSLAAPPPRSPSPVVAAQGRIFSAAGGKQLWAAALGLAASRSPSPQVISSACTCAQTFSLDPFHAQAARHPSPVWPAQARVLPASPGPYMRFSASPDLRAPDWPPRAGTPPAAAVQPARDSSPAVPRSHFFQWGQSNSQRASPLPMHSAPSSPHAAIAAQFGVQWPPQQGAPRSPSYSPQSPTYSPTASGWQPSAARAPTPPTPAAPRQPTPTHVCDARCGFEGSKVEVLEHERHCQAAQAWKKSARAKRRESDRKRKQRAEDAAVAKLVADATAVEYQAYLAQTAAEAAAAVAEAGPAPSSSKPRIKAGSKPHTSSSKAARVLLWSAEDQAKVEQAAQDKARYEESSEHDRQRQIFCDDTEVKASGYAKQLAQNVPKYWTASAKAISEVPKDSDEFREIEAEVMLKLEIDKNHWRPVDYKVHALYRIINRAMWTAFELQRSLAFDAAKHKELVPQQTSTAHVYPNDCERLYHGTTVDAASVIMKHGFNRSAGTNGKHGSILGKGTYFSPLPRLSLSGDKGSLSNIYTPPDPDGFKHLLLCNVLLGNSIVGRPDYHVFPPGVHSTVDTLNNASKICVQQDNSINILYEVLIAYEPAKR